MEVSFLKGERGGICLLYDSDAYGSYAEIDRFFIRGYEDIDDISVDRAACIFSTEGSVAFYFNDRS